jgi:hypothetical protein
MTSSFAIRITIPGQQGIAALVHEIRNAPTEPGVPIPKVLVVGPPEIRSPRGSIAEKFHGAEEKKGALG